MKLRQLLFVIVIALALVAPVSTPQVVGPPPPNQEITPAYCTSYFSICDLDDENFPSVTVCFCVIEVCYDEYNVPISEVNHYIWDSCTYFDDD